MRSTERRPDLYKICPDVCGVCNDVLAIKDHPTKEVLQFGEMQKTTKGWLWDYQGQLLVIATPFHDGVHYATLPGHFIPIIEHLEQMHQNGFVHGDIRAFNMVLEYKNEDPKQETEESTHQGWLIDFDFGGNVGTELKGESNLQQSQSCGYLNPIYPSGYVFDLNDGFRLGRPGKAITKAHDWYALSHIIFVLHELVHQDINVDIYLDNDKDNKQKYAEKQEFVLIHMKKAFMNRKGDYSKLLNQSGELQQPADFLREYLLEAKKYEFKLVPTERFKKFLRKCNMLPRNKLRGDSKRSNR